MSGKHDSKVCVVCLDDNPTYHFIPCNHRCVCENCAKEYITKEDKIFHKCPVCRKEYATITSDPVETFNSTTEEEEEELRFVYALNEIEINNKKSLDTEELLREEEMLQLAYALSLSEIESKLRSDQSLLEEEELHIAIVSSHNEHVTVQQKREEEEERTAIAALRSNTDRQDRSHFEFEFTKSQTANSMPISK